MRTLTKPLTRWEPRADVGNFGRTFNQVFDEMFGRHLLRPTEEAALCGAWMPAVNILEREDGITITVELPGLDAKEVDVTVDNGVMSISGERRMEEAQEGETFHRLESSFGAFERRFTIPRSVDAGKIAASFKNGVMTVNLPKREESKPKSIKIKVDTK